MFRIPVAILFTAAAFAAEQAPYLGKWKLNPDRSNFGESTITYAQLPSGEMQATVDGQQIKFKLDDKDYPSPFGGTGAWKAIDANTWQTTWKVNGKTAYVDTLKLAPDAKTLTVSTKGTKPNGEAMDMTAVFQRVSGTSGLIGKWKTKNFKSSSPEVLELAASGADGLVLKIVDLKLTCDARFDGKDHPCTGPTIAPGWTIQITKPGPLSLDMTTKRNGKTLYQTTYTVTADGKTLIGAGTAVDAQENVTFVYERQ